MFGTTEKIIESADEHVYMHHFKSGISLVNREDARYFIEQTDLHLKSTYS